LGPCEGSKGSIAARWQLEVQPLRKGPLSVLQSPVPRSTRDMRATRLRYGIDRKGLQGEGQICHLTILSGLYYVQGSRPHVQSIVCLAVLGIPSLGEHNEYGRIRVLTTFD
jgi:hypothetical protein